MPSPKSHHETQRSAFRRPYKSRSQRRESARRKYDEATDVKFLVRAGIAIALVIAVALGLVATGALEQSSVSPSLTITK